MCFGCVSVSSIGGERVIEFFSVLKPVIGVVHLNPLPGSPLYYVHRRSFEEILSRALNDVEKLVEGGVDGVIVENFMDIPFSEKIVDPETISAFTTILWEVKKIVRKYGLPIGINLLRNSGLEAARIACSLGVDFIRINAYYEPILSAEGYLKPIAREVQVFLKKRGCRIKVFADVNVKHSLPLLDLVLAAKELEERSLADALIVTGSRTGSETPAWKVYIVRKNTSKPIIVGSGVNDKNIGLYWRIADGFIIGTFFKEKGIVTNPVDINRVKKLMKIVNVLRRRPSR